MMKKHFGDRQIPFGNRQVERGGPSVVHHLYVALQVQEKSYQILIATGDSIPDSISILAIRTIH
jgi:hypothetical protein